MSAKITLLKEKLEEIATPVCAAHGVELVDISYVREPVGAVVRVIIDREPAVADRGAAPVVGSGVSLADCQGVSRDLGVALEVHNAIEGKYRLEVTSPGLDRPLVKLKDFERFKGHEAKVETRTPIQARRRFHGKLLDVQSDIIVFEQDGQPLNIPYQDIARANLVYRFQQR